MTILFIGNSFTGRNDLPYLLAEIASSAASAKSIETDQIIANGASLRQHWNAGVAASAIRRGWDYVVLQEQSTLPIKNAARFHENVRLFHNEIREHGSKTVLYLTWARLNAPESQENLTTATWQIAHELGAVVAPIGEAWKTALRENAAPESTALMLHDKDGSHPSPAGSYLAACVFFGTLFNQSPVGLAVPERVKISEVHAALLQQVAWETVLAIKKG